MLSSVLISQEQGFPPIDLLHPEPLAGGAQPEERVVVCGISWNRYLDFDKTLGDDRPSPRLYFLDGELEIMTTSNEHERVKKWLAGFLEIYFEHAGIEVFPRGQATMRLAAKGTGAEPDESWCIGEEKEFPDLVLEVALTTGGIRKLEAYRRFKVPEVWFWRENKLEIFALSNLDEYEPVRMSRLFKDLDISLIERCISIQAWQQARRAFRAGLSTPK